MPFAYYGSKHGLASKYPRPRHRVVVEPFAGSAAYSVHHAASIDRAILYDTESGIVDLWHELQQMTPADVDAVGGQLAGERTSHLLLAGIAGSGGVKQILRGGTCTVTSRMIEQWPGIRARIIRTLPYIRRWEIRHGDYTDAPDIEATWFIDPPYQENGTMAGSGYASGTSGIDFDHLGAWCRDRRGLTLVCEQSPARWLPFFPFAVQCNGTSTNRVPRQELIWRSDLEQPSLFEGGAA